MAVDNPSYFSLSTQQSTSQSSSQQPPSQTPSQAPIQVTSQSPSTTRAHTGLTAFFRRRGPKMGVGSGLNAPSTLHQDGDARTSGISGGCSQRKSFRNLFRSVSANADHERTQQFLKGDPRPSDVAPPSPYLPHRSHSHSENDRRRPDKGRRVLKSASELLSNDMVYCGLSGDGNTRVVNDDDDDEDSEPTEVFLGVDDARYYNLSSTLPTPGSAAAGRRRHSIGTFLGKDRSRSSSRNLVEPDVIAPPVPLDVVDGNIPEKAEGRTRRRRHRSSSSGKGPRPTTKVNTDGTGAGHGGSFDEDVAFVSCRESEAANLWVNYLTACFEQISRQQGRPPFKVKHVTIEDACPEENLHSARLQIIVVCPILLESTRKQPDHVTRITRHLKSERILAMMLGVHDGHIGEGERSALLSYDRWRKFFVKDQDETFVGEFLGAAVGLLGTATPPALKSDKTAFSVHPKKVKLGQNRIIALLNDPLRPEDNVSVIVDRCGEAIEISHVKRRNPYALQFSIPERCLEVSMLVGIRVTRNGCPLGVRQVKCESRLRELDQILRAHDNPLEFMCQTFGFNPGDREQLDNWMVHAFQRNVPPHFNLLSTPSGVVPAHKNHTSPEENPTLLHFAARFGLERLAWQLLECPGGDLACDLRNVSEMTPADLAEQAGHARLAHQLRGYMQMNEFTNMYSYLKGISENAAGSAGDQQTNDDDKEDYCRPRPLSEAYSVPPAARPVTTLVGIPQLATFASNSTSNGNNNSTNSLEANYSIVPTPTPVLMTNSTTSLNSVHSNSSQNMTNLMNSMESINLTNPGNTRGCGSGSVQEGQLQGYMKMQSAGAKAPSQEAKARAGTPTTNRHDVQNSNSTNHKDDTNQSSSASYGRTASSSSSKGSREPSGPQDELLEIINDFKNNVFTISEVERLVDNWRNRNDVQQSFKDKQRQLTLMREEYERIQKRMKDEMKAPTPFDRIRKFFSKSKKDSKDSTNGHDEPSSSSKAEANGAMNDRRPVSSLSLRSVSSSSSSGRMSTVSGCSGTSLGDSGTHSDPEDRRLQNREEKGGVTSYEIPPAPKPFTGRYSPAARYTPSPRSSTAIEIDVRTSQTSSKVEENEYYIAFPPSGLPVHSFKSDGSLREPKTPSSPCDHARYLDVLQDSSQNPDTEIPKPNYTNIDPTTNAPIPPPGMCIPTSYMNISPNKNVQETRGKEVQSEVKDEKTENNVKTDCVQSQQEYVETDSFNVPDADVVDGGRWPEYMNVNPCQEVKMNVGGNKKIVGPPVPPRASTKK